MEPDDDPFGFTLLELQLLEVLPTGMSNKRTAAVVLLSPDIVKGTLKELYRKIGAKNRTQAALWAERCRDR